MTGDSGPNKRRAGRGRPESRAPEGTRRTPHRACALTFTLPPESGPNSAILLNILSQGRSRGRQERAQAGGVSRAEGFRLEMGESPGLAAPNCLLHTRGGAVGHSAPRWESGAEGVCVCGGGGGDGDACACPSATPSGVHCARARLLLLSLERAGRGLVEI